MSVGVKEVFVRDLSALIKLIEYYEVPVEVAKLYALESQLISQKNHFVKVENIAINVSKKISGTNPPDVSKLVIYFSHKCEIDLEKDAAVNDPVTTYYFFFQVNGYNIEADREITNCWRLDQDIVSEKSKYTHPYYHFQAGGDELLGLDTGDLILLSAPRLPHPPMDLFLGLHFLLNNYLSTKDYPSVKKLFIDYDYQAIIKRSQQRMWEAYFNSFNSSNTHSDFTFQKVFPLFLH